MKHFILLCVTCIMTISLTGQANSADAILSPAEITQLFTDQTFTAVSYERKDRAQGKPFKVFTSGMGLVRSLSETGAVVSRAWSVTDKGQVCFSSSFTNRKGGGTCGFLVTDGGGTYRIYNSKKLKERGGVIAGAKRNDLILELSGFVAGNSLEQ